MAITDKEWKRLKAIRDTFAEPNRHAVYWDEDTVLFLLSLVTQLTTQLQADQDELRAASTGPIHRKVPKREVVRPGLRLVK